MGLVERPAEWMDEAMCLGHPEEFDDEGTDKALEICGACPVLATCAARALEQERGLPEEYRQGIFGGLRPSDRVALDRRAGVVIEPPEDVDFVEVDRRTRLNCILCGDPLSKYNRTGICCNQKRQRTRIVPIQEVRE